LDRGDKQVWKQFWVAVRHRIEDLGKAPGTRLHLGGLNSVSRRLALTMKHERAIKKAGYVTLAALLALVAFSFWVSHRIERGETPAFLSEGAASVVASICALIFHAAVALAVFICFRAFYLGLTQSDSREKHENDG
jgi:hypothetical protein